MDKLQELWAKAKVVSGSLITLFTGLAVTVTAFADQVASVAPEGWQDNVLSISAVVVAWLTFAVAALRHVTPVPPNEVGILPE
jgi:hypothetical protein